MRQLCSLALLLGMSAALASAAESPEPVGRSYRVDPGALPAPYASGGGSNPSSVVERPQVVPLQVPPGFRANIFHEGFRHARWLAAAENGDVFVAETRADRVRLIRDADGDGEAEELFTFTDEIARPHGLAIAGGYLYVSDPRQVWRYAYRPGQIERTHSAELVTPAGALGDGGGHSTRSLAVSPDGRHLYVAVGSRGNLGEEREPRATVQRFSIDGKEQTTFAAGLRNPVGIAFRPGTSDLYVTVNERDGLGDELPPDYLTRVRAGEFYGWPYAYTGSHPDPDLGLRRPDLVAKSRVPDLLFRSHSAPLGLVFYDGKQFPEVYRGDAFVALHGSWNAAKPRGYMVARVPFRDGQPAGTYESFVTGFWIGGEAPPRVWGRPAGLAVAKDGSLLIADDVAGIVWRVAYVGG